MVYRPSPSDSAVRRVPTTLTPTRATGVPVSRARTTPAIAPLESWAVAPPAAASNAAQPIRQTRIVLMRNAPNGSEARPQQMRRARDGERRTTRSAAPTVRYGQPVPVQRTRLPLLFVDRTKVPAAPPMRAQGARQGGARTPHPDPEPSQTIVRTINTRDFSRATRSTSRQINRLILLNLVRELQPISRADLARRMAVGRGMVTTLVKELLAEGAVYEGALADVPRGRRPKMLHVRTRDRLVVAIDIRFSRTYVLLSDFGGNEMALESFATIFNPDQLLDELAIRVRRLLRTRATGGHCEGIGMVVPGMVDRRGRVLNAPQLGWRDVQIRSGLAERTGLPVHVENSGAACALAHIWLGPGEGGNGVRDFVYVTVSDGVGTGVVVNGELVRGHGHTAGEFGHIPIGPDGPRCVCGAQGCLEAHTSNLATVARYVGHEQSPAVAPPLFPQDGITMDDVIVRAGAGDERARAALTETGRYLGLGLAAIVNALNPAQIVIGGEITGAWDLVEPAIRAEIARRALTREAAGTPVVPEPAGSLPRLRGAIALVAAPVYAAPEVG
ncbi:MAG: hypothetical protein DMD32_08375 [Gemmatimonadetes bacterium]|nr:MAG: hypothetical protein DMD32_08375 [Gemmatimonadota bacterium]